MVFGQLMMRYSRIPLGYLYADKAGGRKITPMKTPHPHAPTITSTNPS